MALATLSIDLEARLGKLQSGLDKATRLAEKDSERMERAFARVRDVAASIGSGLVAGLSVRAVTQFLTQTGEAGAAIERLAKLSNQSAEEFQRYAAGARTVGIEQDKLSDIFKDTQDKVGDFLTTGAGPLADFFEKIAPQVGVTAEQFRNLGGKDALQLYVSSLEKANLSQSEMIFFLEAIASDSALLLPLLKDNGRGFKELGDQAERLGGILSDEAVRSAAEFDRNLEKLSTRVLGLARDISGPLITAMNDLFDISERGQRQGGGFLTGFLDQLEEDYLRAREIATREQVEQARPGFERAQAILAQQPDSIRAKATIAEFRELEAAARRYREEVQAASASAFPSSNVQGGRGSIIPPFAAQPTRPPGKPPKPGRAARAGSAPWETDTLLIYQADQLREALELIEQVNAAAARAAVPSDPATDTLLIYQADQLREAFEVIEQVNEEAERGLGKVNEAAKDLGLSFSSAFEDAIVSGNGLRELLQGLEQDILRIVTRQLVTQPLANGITNLLNGSGGGGGLISSIGSFLGNLIGGGRAVGGPVSAGGVYPVNELGPELLETGGQQYLLMGKDSGRVYPNDSIRGGRGGDVHFTQIVNVAGTPDRRTQQQLFAAAARGVERASSRNN